MGDPVSIAGLSLQVAQILGPVVIALGKAIRDGKTVHHTLQELHADLEVIYDLVSNINSILDAPRFIDVFQSIQEDGGPALIGPLKRSLERCSREAQTLLEILLKLGLQTRQGAIKQAYLQWRLDRRSQDIDALKQRLQDHRGSIQLGFQCLTMWKQLQISDRDNVSVQGLKAQMDGLHKAIEHVLVQLSSKAEVPKDEEQTQIFDEMKSMHDTSMHLQRQATVRLEYITSLTEQPASQHEGDNTTSPTTPTSSLLPSFHTRFSGPILANMGERGAETLPSSSTTHMSTNVFEDEFTKLLARATTQNMGVSKRYSEDFFVHLSILLNAVGKCTWGERPRTYLVLRLIGEVRVMERFVFEGFKDIHFPYDEKTIPSCVGTSGARHNFLSKQDYVLSPRSADLVQGGRHRHLDSSADAFFNVITKLGSGGFSVVDKVQHKLTLEDYARKKINRNGSFSNNKKVLAFFENEIQQLKRLSHLHLVKFVGSYTDRRYIGIIMQPVADIDLHRYLTRPDLTSEDLVLLRSFVGCLCSALGYLHDQKCRHKDLKPQNILIKGQTVLLADFGTALDWTDLENDITAGPPEAFTKLYMAPEVARHELRDASSDIWSLGCVFLEMVTLLSGFSLQRKSDFFEALETSSAAYFLNHDGISHWISQLMASSGHVDEPLCTMIESMTALDPHSRPTAKELVRGIPMKQTNRIQYGRYCCFEALDDDISSYEGSVSDDDVFETAKTVSDVVTVTTTGSLSMTEPLEVDPSAEKPISPTVQQRSSRIPVYRARSTPSPSAPASDPRVEASGSLSLPRHQLFEEKARRKLVLGFATSQHEVPVEKSQAVSATDAVPGTLESRTIQEAESVASTVLEIEKAFLASHQQLENYLLGLRRRNSTGWLSYLLPLVESHLLDDQRLSLLHVASKFNNAALSRAIVEFVLHEQPRLVNEVTVHGHSALHYAAYKGRVKLINFLIEKGVKPNVQNRAGDTPLHIALSYDQLKASMSLIPHLSPDDINVKNISGRSPIFFACANAPTAIIHQLMNAGALLNAPDHMGITPLQACQLHNESDVANELNTRILRDMPDLDKGEPVSTSQFWDRLKGKEFSDCYCRYCTLRRVVEMSRTGNERVRSIPPQDKPGNQSGAGKVIFCPCPNHLRRYAKDYLTIVTLKTCKCIECDKARERNAKNVPCGTPIGNDYLPYNDHVETLSRVPEPYTDPPSLLSGADFINKPLPPYPGHKYYDYLIEKALNAGASEATKQHATTVALKTLADAGFRGRNSYRKKPTKALQWVILNFRHISEAATLCEMVRILLDSGADLECLSYDERSILKCAAIHQNVSLLQLLIDRKADVKRTLSGWTPLQLAVNCGQAVSARMLLRAGADVDAQGAGGLTSLHRAIASCDRGEGLIPLLLAHGALPEIPDKFGDTPLHLAVKNTRIHGVQALLVGGADIDARGRNNETPLTQVMESKDEELIRTLLEHGATVCRRDWKGYSALESAIHQGLVSTVRLLLGEYDADQSIQKPTEFMKMLDVLANSPFSDPDTIEVLLGYGTNVNAKDRDGNTPLHNAARSGNTALARKLREHGASTHLQNRKGLTPLDMAKRHRTLGVVVLLGGTYTDSWGGIFKLSWMKP